MSIDASRSADIASPIRAWHDRAEQLTDWAIARVFVRTDRFGGYYRDGEEVKKSARPNKGCGEPFSREVLIRHFRAEQTEDVIGAYPLIPGEESTGRWVAIDIDAHDKTKGADPERNRKYAEHLYRKLTALGFGVLACHWGTGGYHLWVFLDRDVPGAVLFAFARWIVLDATDAPWDYPERPETFPKQASVATGKYGNWLRLVGRHHTQRRFPA
ncbi:MAG TPA: peptidase, partial [Gemmataceae bacterium]|nr:peptidase [Gemmataceae bacterium]